MSVKLLTEHNLEFLSLKGGCTGSSESTLVKCQIVGNLMPRLINVTVFSYQLVILLQFQLASLSTFISTGK